MITATRILGFICAWAACDKTFPIPNVVDNRPIDKGPPKIQTNSGRISGYYMSTISSRVIGAYEGIPYAENPSGELRFRNPVRKIPWNGTLKANRRITCIQMDPSRYYGVVGQEDCLVLNVYTPVHKTVANLPVLVMIHGGSWFWGSGAHYGPSYLLDYDVILVTLNYRVGPLGFFSSGDLGVTGNFGLKDQAMALRWVTENIMYFGGNPRKITLAGHSAGAASVHLHMMSPLSRGNFQHAISLSGTALAFWATPQSQTVHGNRWMKAVGCSPSEKNKSNVLECLRRKPVHRLVSMQYDLFELQENPSVLFGPVVEPKHSEAFLAESPEETYRRRNVANIPWMTGILRDEGDLYTLANYATPLAIRKVVKNLDNSIPIVLDYNRSYTELTTAIKKFYFGDSPKFSFSGFEALNTISQMVGDRYFYVPFHKTLETHTKTVQAPLYAYYFTFDGKHSLSEKVNLPAEEWGVMHQDELQYLFNSSYLYYPLQTLDKDFEISTHFTNLVVNFANTGDPNNFRGKLHKSNSKVWEAYSFENPKLLEINFNAGMTGEPNLYRINFWESIQRSHY